MPNIVYFGNCINDRKRDNEINLDLKTTKDTNSVQFIRFSNCWLKTSISTSDTNRFYNVRVSNNPLKYKDLANYKFETETGETRIKGFDNLQAKNDAKVYIRDIEGVVRNTGTPITIGPYYIP